MWTCGANKLVPKTSARFFEMIPAGLVSDSEFLQISWISVNQVGSITRYFR